MIRPTVSLIAILLLAPLVNANGAHGPAPHSPSVIAVSHYPDSPDREQDVSVQMATHPQANVTEVRLVYCRVQQYACGPPMLMTKGATGVWTATIPWNKPEESRPAEFWQGVTDVGYNLTLVHGNDSSETSPLHDWPSAPPGFFVDANYYFYKLPPGKADTPGPDLLALVIGALAALFVIRRRR